MENVFTGKVIAITNGRKADDNSWYTMNVVVQETDGQYPQTMCGEVFSSEKNPRWKNMDINIGELLKVHYEFNAHKYNDKQTGAEKWFGSVNIWKVERAQSHEPAPQPAVPVAEASAAFPAGGSVDASSGNPFSGMPF